MKILVTGSSGLVGTALTSALAAAGHTVCRLVRPQSIGGEGAKECAAQRSGVGVCDWDLWRPRRRNIDRGERARHGLSSKLGEGMGSGSVESRGAGNPRGARTVWDYFGAGRRRAAEDDAAVQGWRWGKTGLRSAVDVVGDTR